MSDSLERLAGACLLPGFAGHVAPDWLLRELDVGLGGVVLFARNVRDPEQVRRLCASIRVEETTIVAIDEEGGDVTRLEAARGSSVPAALALGEVDDPALTEQVALAVARALREVGITHDLAPVADVNTNPLNPVIGVRSFGSDPALVARHVAAAVTGLQAGGVASCVKHFPGHGASDVDSHLGLPVVEATQEELAAVELAPFRAAFAAGARSVMTAHLVVPALDTLPATLSRHVLTDLLRGELGFTGMAVTDALEMGAISNTYGMGQAAVLALAAGADTLCLGHDIDASHVQLVRSAIVAAVAERRLGEDRLAEAAARAAASHLYGVASEPDGGSLAEIGLAAARRALSVTGDVGDRGPQLVVELEGSLSVAAGEPSHDLYGLLVDLGADVERLSLEATEPAAAIAAVEGHTGRRPVVVVRDLDRHQWQRPVATTLAADGRTVVVDVGYPSHEPLAAARQVTTFGAGRASLLAAAEQLLATR